MKATEFSEEELKQKIKGLRSDLMKLRFDKARGELKNPMKIQDLRRDIARTLTALKSKERKEK